MMIPMPMQPDILKKWRARRAGSALVAVLAALVLTSVIVGAALFEAGNRYRTTQHSVRWVQASHAAEAGAELALLSAQKDSWVADGWGSAPGAPGAPAVVNAFPLSTGVPGVGPVSANVSVERILMGTVRWLRIRSTGEADVSGGALADVDTRDVILRKLSLRRDRTTGTSVATPRSTRTVEILAEPATRSPFQRAILTDQKITMSSSTSVDSFDSADPAKSTGGLYDIIKRQWGGNVGMNNTMGSSNLGSAFIYGDLSYSGTAPSNTANVQGVVSSQFTDPVLPVTAPNWTTFNAYPTIIGTSMTLTGGTEASPARYKVSSVNVPGGKVLTLAPHAPGAESYIEIWVTGKLTTSSSGYIAQQPGVHVIYHVEGDVSVTSASFTNQTNLAANNLINVTTPPVGVTRKVAVSGSGNFIGAINSPGAVVTVSSGASLSGAIIGKTMAISGGSSVHYDAALKRITGNVSIGSYRVRSWVEAVR
jgi:hypothetical protein